MATSRLEINFIRLLSRCESLASEKRNETEWRLEKYVGALEEMLVALKKSPSKPTPEVLTDYNRKVDFLKGLLEADKLPSPAEKSLANQFLAPGRTPTISSERTPASKTVHIQSKARCEHYYIFILYYHCCCYYYYYYIIILYSNNKIVIINIITYLFYSNIGFFLHLI
uniref:Vesicle transport protein USE1 n=1 Tax=Sinocyclocheilus anshuiensis TaxID=1608454 RepID=A0A671T646_9TELE